MIVRPVVCRPFIGRREELAYLHERRLEAGSSRGGLVLIAGDAGVGKSRLIRAFTESTALARWHVATAACDESASRPYGPILDVLARLDGRSGELEHAASKQAQLDAMLERFSALCARRAVCVVIEDVHWADAATLDVLAHVGARLHGRRILMLATLRPHDAHPDHPIAAALSKVARDAHAGRIDLAPLAGTELLTFIDEALAGRTLPDETRRAIVVAGEGNPFFTEELLKSALEAVPPFAARRRKRPIPQSLRTTLLERLRRFDDDERRVLGHAAVIGRTFGVDLLASTLDVEKERTLVALRRARDVQLVEETDGGFRFRHGLTREAIYGEFLSEETRPRHRAIAVALEEMPEDARSLEALAYHWWAAGEGTKAVLYNELAGDAAARVHANEDAIGFYERALEAPDLLPGARGALVEKIASRRVSLAAIAEAQAAYGAAADAFQEAGDAAREAVCRNRAAILAYTSGRPNPTAPLEAMLARLEPGEYLARSRVHLGLAWLHSTFWFPTQAERHLACVDPRARTEEPGIELRFRNVSAWVAMINGDVDTLRREHAAWIEAAGAVGTVAAKFSAHCNGAMCFSYVARFDEAQEHLDHARRIARAARFTFGEECVSAVATMLHFLRGDLASARRELDGIPTTSESRINIAFATAWGTLVGLHLGDRPLLERWFDGFEATMQATPEVECGAGFAEMMARRGRDSDAADFLRRAIPECERMRGNVPTLIAAARYGATRERARARAYLERGASDGEDMPEGPALALFDALEFARAKRLSESQQLAREAAAGFRRLHMPLFEASALETAGDAAGALAIFRRCGALHDVNRLEGTAAPHDAENSSTFEPLSQREREIVELAVEGLSNIEIARRLSIARQTVEKHIASAYRKLGVTSRAKLGALVWQHRRP